MVKGILSKRHTIFSSINWIFALARPIWPGLLLLIFLQAIGGMTGVGMALSSKFMIDAAVGGQISQMWLWSGAFAGVIILDLIIEAGLTLVNVKVGETFENTVRERIFSMLAGTEWFAVSQYHSGDLMTRLTSDVNTIASSVTQLIPQMISLSIRFVIAFVVLYVFDPILAILAFVLVPVSLLLSRVMGRPMKKLYHQTQEAESSFREFLQERLQHILIVKSFQLEKDSQSQLTTLHQERLHWIVKRSHYSIFAEAILSLGYWSGYFLALAWGAYRLSTKSISFGTVAAFLQLVEQLQGPLTGLAYSFPQIIAAIGSAERIMELEALEKEGVHSQSHTMGPVGFKLNQVDFAYEGEDQVLEDVSMCVAPHEIVALMGPSGEGKTTIVRLLLALIKPTQGEIMITDDTGKDIPINASTRQFMTYVPQGNTLFSGTIEDNLKVADQSASQADLMEALVKADAWAFVQELPEGLMTFLGEDGLGISEGQAQRIAIARALLRKAPILILDEATSALDLDAEERILKAIHEDPIKRTCLIITHRPSALRICDRIFKLVDKTVSAVEAVSVLN